MMHFKNHKCERNGFTLIETILSITIAALVLTPVFVLHSAVLKRVIRGSHAFNALLQGKLFLGQARQKQEPDAQEFKLEKKIEEPALTLDYVLHKSVDKKSSLSSCEGLHAEVVTITWTDQGDKRQEKLVTFVYK